MASKTTYPSASVGLLTDVDTIVNSLGRNPFGFRSFDDAGNEFIYLPGVASTVIGSVVNYLLTSAGAFQTLLTVTTQKGPVGFAMSANNATTTAGWYQIYGVAVGNYNGAAVSGAQLFSASTGKCDDAAVAGDEIAGAVVGATVSGSGLGSVFTVYANMQALT